MRKQPLDPRTLRWASLRLRQRARNRRRNQMICGDVSQAGLFRAAANELDLMADGLLHDARLLEGPGKRKGGG
jgi:hypothetical protein